MDYYQSSNPYQKNIFATISLMLGIFSVTACCTGVLSLPLGALGILFAILTYRKGKQMNPLSIAGIVFSAIGMLTGLAMLIYTFVALPSLMEDESFREQMNAVSEQMYGIEFDTLMEEAYGYELTE